jgi:hypothetical protein
MPSQNRRRPRPSPTRPSPRRRRPIQRPVPRRKPVRRRSRPCFSVSIKFKRREGLTLNLQVGTALLVALLPLLGGAGLVLMRVLGLA